jgi:hypothetical protein
LDLLTSRIPRLSERPRLMSPDPTRMSKEEWMRKASDHWDAMVEAYKKRGFKYLSGPHALYNYAHFARYQVGDESQAELARAVTPKVTRLDTALQRASKIIGLPLRPPARRGPRRRPRS